MKIVGSIAKTVKKAAKGTALAALGAVGVYYGAIFYGIMDHLYQPECFRAGKKPEPSAETAPGKAKVMPRQARTADRHQVVVLRFTAGPGGISEDGGVKVGLCRLIRWPDGRRRANFVLPYGWGILQNTHPARPNHFTVELNSHGGATPEVERKPSVPVRFGLRIAAREWLLHRGVKFEPLDYTYLILEQSKVKIRVRGGRLEEGDEIVVTLGNRLHGGSGWEMPARPIHTEFLVEVDERALGRYRLIEELPALEVMGAEADHLELNLSAPSVDSVRGTVRAVDGRGDTDPTFQGEVAVSHIDGDPLARITVRPDDQGCHALNLELKGGEEHLQDVIYLEARSSTGGRSLEGRSNPILDPVPGEPRLFWGDIHNHTALCDATAGPEQAYLRARDEFGLDFAALSCHDTLDVFEPSGRTADENGLLVSLVKKYNQDGRFVALLGYEWTNHRQGHRNVYFSPAEKNPVFLDNHDPECDTVEKLTGRLSGKQCLIVPHHPGWRKMFYLPFNLTKFLRLPLPPAYHWGDSCDGEQRLVEIYASHGDSEDYHGPYPITHGKRRFFWPGILWDDRGQPGLGSYAREALALGRRFGFIAGSDRHDHAVDERRVPLMVYPNGLAAVWAESLTARAIWQSLLDRRTYGTTGARILLQFSVNGLPMGSEGILEGKPEVSLRVAGTSPLACVEVVKYDLRGYTTVATLTPGNGLGSNDLVVVEGFRDADIVDDTFYYLRVSQDDGHWAWSSPVWLDRR